MNRTRLGTVVGGIGILLFLLKNVASELLYMGPLRFLSGFVDLWWAFLGVGAAVYAIDYAGFKVPYRSGRGGISRQDIITSTNWSRENKHEIRKTLGIAIAIAGIVGVALSVVLEYGQLKILWAILAAGGLIMYGLAWRLSRGIKADHTREISVRLPDQIAVHTFHIKLRQLVEDKGYVVASETSPGKSGREAAFDPGVFLAHGSFKARRRPIADPLVLFGGDAEEEVPESLLSAITVGLVLLVVGVSLRLIQPGPTATDPNMALYDAVHLFGLLGFVGGVGLAAYGYVRRTREWGEIYCVEEGTLYGSQINMYDEETLANIESHVSPNAAAADSACELVVTLGASCTSLFDEDELLEDLQDVAEQIEGLAENQRHEFFESGHETQHTTDQRVESVVRNPEDGAQ